MPAYVWLIIPGGLVFFVGLWMGVSFVMALLGGWVSLARRYRTERKDDVARWDFVGGRLGLVSYRGVLKLAANKDGLFLDVLPIFRMGHPRLFIPWTDISICSKTFLFFRSKAWSLGQPSLATLRLNYALADEIEQLRPDKLLDN